MEKRKMVKNSTINYQVLLLLREELQQAINYYSSQQGLNKVDFILKTLYERCKDFICENYGYDIYEKAIEQYSTPSAVKLRRKEMEQALKGLRGRFRETKRRILEFIQENNKIEHIGILEAIFNNWYKTNRNKAKIEPFASKGFRYILDKDFSDSQDFFEILKTLVKNINEKQPKTASFTENTFQYILVINPQ